MISQADIVETYHTSGLTLHVYILNLYAMEMRIKEGTLTYVKEFDDDVTPEEMLIGAYELIAKVYSQQSVINAYYNTDPDTMDIRTD